MAFGRVGDRVVGMARLLSDGVCNAYLLDVWTLSAYRRQGIGAAMVRRLMSRVPGQHIGLQTDEAESFYARLGYAHQPVFMSAVAELVAMTCLPETDPKPRSWWLLWLDALGKTLSSALGPATVIRRLSSSPSRLTASFPRN